MYVIIFKAFKRAKKWLKLNITKMNKYKISKNDFIIETNKLISEIDKEKAFNDAIDVYTDNSCVIANVMGVSELAFSYLINLWICDLEKSLEEADWFVIETNFGRELCLDEPYIIKINDKRGSKEFVIDSVDSYYDYLEYYYS